MTEEQLDGYACVRCERWLFDVAAEAVGNGPRGVLFACADGCTGQAVAR